MVVGFVFAAIQHYDAGVTPIEGSVCLASYIVHVLSQTDGISISDFMVTSHKQGRDAVAMNTFGQQTDEAGGLGMVGGVVDAIAVEYHEVVIHILHLLEEGFEYGCTLMQVVEDNGCKGVCS